MPEQTPALETGLTTQKALLLKRDKRLHERFGELYKTNRLRVDDVMAQLEAEFFVSQRTIRGILKQDV